MTCASCVAQVEGALAEERADLHPYFTWFGTLVSLDKHIYRRLPAGGSRRRHGLGSLAKPDCIYADRDIKG